MAITKELKYIHIVTNYGSVKKKKTKKEQNLGICTEQSLIHCCMKKATCKEHIELYPLSKKGWVDNMHIHVFAYICVKDL